MSGWKDEWVYGWWDGWVDEQGVRWWVELSVLTLPCSWRPRALLGLSSLELSWGRTWAVEAFAAGSRSVGRAQDEGAIWSTRGLKGRPRWRERCVLQAGFPRKKKSPKATWGWGAVFTFVVFQLPSQSCSTLCHPWATARQASRSFRPYKIELSWFLLMMRTELLITLSCFRQRHKESPFKIFSPRSLT